MKKTYFFFLIALLITANSCTPKTPKEQLLSDLKKSKTFQDYVQFCKHLTIGIKKNLYNNAGVDKNYINSHGGGNLHSLPTKKLYEVYSRAKMTNAADYINTQLEIDSTYKKLMIDFPQLTEMGSVERFDFLVSVRRQMDDFVSK